MRVQGIWPGGSGGCKLYLGPGTVWGLNVGLRVQGVFTFVWASDQLDQAIYSS